MLRRRPFAEPIVALALAVLTSLPGPAHAGAPPTDAEVSQARDRFTAARKLEDGGHWAEALSLFQRVAEVRTTPQVRFHVALCMENVGLWTHALDGYALAAEEAGTAAPEVVREANEHLRKLGPQVPTVSLHVVGAASGDEFLLDRRHLALDDHSLPFRADPGPHTAEVRRDGTVVARAFFALEARTARHVELRIGAIAPEQGEALAPYADVPPPGRPQRALGWTAIGVGGASLVVTGIFAGLRAAAMSQLKAACPSLTECPASVAPTVGAGKTDAIVVNVSAVLGGVATAAGVALLVLAPGGTAGPARSPAGSPTAAAWLELRADGHVVLRGAF